MPQLAQAEDSVPVSELVRRFPAAQAVHEADVLLLYFPLPQSEHDPALLPLNSPAPQVTLGALSPLSPLLQQLSAELWPGQ